MLIGTNTDLTYKEVKYGLGNVSVGDYQQSMIMKRFVSMSLSIYVQMWIMTLYLKAKSFQIFYDF